MSNASQQTWIERDGEDHLVKGFLNAGTVRHQSGATEPRWVAVSNCSRSYYGRTSRFFATRSEARAWVESLLAQYEEHRANA